MELSSPAFEDGGKIPAEHAYRGDNVSPPLEIAEVPAGTKELVLICDDPDAPRGTWVHWLVWKLDPGTKTLAKGKLPAGAVQGNNSWGKASWGGPAPPSGTHHYVFKLHALDTPLALKPGADVKALEAAMKGKVLESAKLVGLFSAD